MDSGRASTPLPLARQKQGRHALGSNVEEFKTGAYISYMLLVPLHLVIFLIVWMFLFCLDVDYVEILNLWIFIIVCMLLIFVNVGSEHVDAIFGGREGFESNQLE